MQDWEGCLIGIMEVNGAPGGGGHAPRSKRPALPNHHSWRSQLEGEGRGASGQPAGGALVPECLSSRVTPSLLGTIFA